MSDFEFQEIFEFGPDETEYRKLSSDHVSTATVSRVVNQTGTVAEETTARVLNSAFWAGLVVGRLIAIPVSMRLAPGTMITPSGPLYSWP